MPVGKERMKDDGGTYVRRDFSKPWSDWTVRPTEESRIPSARELMADDLELFEFLEVAHEREALGEEYVPVRFEEPAEPPFFSKVGEKNVGWSWGGNVIEGADRSLWWGRDTKITFKIKGCPEEVCNRKNAYQADEDDHASEDDAIGSRDKHRFKDIEKCALSVWMADSVVRLR